MKVAKARGRLRGKQPKLSPTQEAHLVALHKAGEHTNAELAELFSGGRSTVYRALERAQAERQPETLGSGWPPGGLLLARIGAGDSTVTSIPNGERRVVAGPYPLGMSSVSPQLMPRPRGDRLAGG